MTRNRAAGVVVSGFFLGLCAVAFAQDPAQMQPAPPAASQAAGTTVPRLLSFSSVVNDSLGKPVSGPISVTFSLFAEQEGGTPLWSETQVAEADTQGKYTVFLGATNPAGLPLELFTTGAARWLAIEPVPPAAIERSRVLLVGVPYAFKAADADTLGGKPASAYLTTESQTPSSAASTGAPAQTIVVPATAVTSALAGTGTTDYVPLWTSSTELGDSILFQSGTAMEVKGTLELPALGTATSSTGYDSEPLDLFASVYSSTSKAAVAQHFRWEAEPVSNDTSSPSGKVDLLYASGTGTPAETGLSISSKGLITFAPGQTLPAVSGNETVTGNVSASQLISTIAQGTAPMKVTSTTQVTNLNASLLGGKAASAFQPAGSYATLGVNSFAGTQYISGNLVVSGGFFVEGNLTDPNTGNTSANVLDGYGSGVGAGVTGATIAGGGGVAQNQFVPNTVSDDFGTVGGGIGNTAGQGNGNGQWATVAGGYHNTASGVASSVAGGFANTASGYYSFAAGSYAQASGDYSFAAGVNAQASEAGSFVWCQTNGDACASQGTNSFTVNVAGPIYFFDGPGGAGCHLSAGSGSWSCSSDRNLKDNIRSIDARSVLQRVAQMPILQWSMKADAEGHDHIGPMAQDFYAAFGLGDSDKYIAQGDAQGVALASIQGLYQMVQQKDEEIEALKVELRALEERVARK